jgi:hypothetical protein
MHNHTTKLVDLPPKNKLLGHKWIIKRKMKANGTINKYKTRLVKVFKQQENVDYFDIYSSMLKNKLYTNINSHHNY